MSHPELLALAGAYIAATGKSEATLANYSGNDGRFFARLRAGSRCWPEKRERLIKWFSDHWPKGAEWPAGLERPIPSESAGPARRPPWGKSAANPPQPIPAQPVAA